MMLAVGSDGVRATVKVLKRQGQRYRGRVAQIQGQSGDTARGTVAIQDTVAIQGQGGADTGAVVAQIQGRGISLWEGPERQDQRSLNVSL
jgi:hypothetical protein